MKPYKDETIKFSVLIPVYNVETYLKECLDSVLSQTYSNFEIVITNDGSNDKSGNICNEYARLDDRIFVHHQENKGLLSARRASISRSSGDYCLFLDSDDSWKKNTLETVYNVIKKSKADMVIFNWDKIVENEIISSEPLFENRKEFSGDSKSEIVEKFITTNDLNSLCLKAVKAKVIDKENDYLDVEGLIMGEDALQSIPLFLNSQKIVYIQKPLYNYRINKESSTNMFNPRHIFDINVVNKSKFNLANKINRPDLLNPLGVRYINTIAKQIMIASTSNLSRSEKIKYLKDLRLSDFYTLMAEYYEVSDLILPVNMLINNLNNQKFEKVIRLGKIFNFFWQNLGGLRFRIRQMVLDR